MSDKYFWQEILDGIIADHGKGAEVTVWSPSGGFDFMPADEAANFIFDHYDHFDVPNCGISYATDESKAEILDVSADYSRRLMGLPSEWQRFYNSPGADLALAIKMQCSECEGSGNTKTGGRCPVCRGSGFKPSEDK